MTKYGSDDKKKLINLKVEWTEVVSVYLVFAKVHVPYVCMLAHIYRRSGNLRLYFSRKKCLCV